MEVRRGIFGWDLDDCVGVMACAELKTDKAERLVMERAAVDAFWQLVQRACEGRAVMGPARNGGDG